MAHEETPDLLRSARLKILQNCIFRQNKGAEIEFCRIFGRVLPLQGLATKAGGRLYERPITGLALSDRRTWQPFWLPDQALCSTPHGSKHVFATVRATPWPRPAVTIASSENHHPCHPSSDRFRDRPCDQLPTTAQRSEAKLCVPADGCLIFPTRRYGTRSPTPEPSVRDTREGEAPSPEISGDGFAGVRADLRRGRTQRGPGPAADAPERARRIQLLLKGCMDQAAISQPHFAKTKSRRRGRVGMHLHDHAERHDLRSAYRPQPDQSAGRGRDRVAGRCKSSVERDPAHPRMPRRKASPSPRRRPSRMR